MQVVKEDISEEGGVKEVMAIGSDNKMTEDVTIVINLVVKKWTTIRSKMILEIKNCNKEIMHP